MTITLAALPQGSVTVPDGMFFLTVDPEDTTNPFFLGVYPKSGPDRHVYKGSNAAAAVQAFNDAQAEYPNIKFPKSYLDSIKFLGQILDSAISIDVPLNEPVYCDGCYDTNQDTLRGYYYPAISDDEVSMQLTLNTGCYNQTDHIGSVADGTKDDILNLISVILDGDLDDDVRQEIVEFAQRLNNPSMD